MKCIHPSAIIHPSTIISENSIIGPNSIIGANVKIGQNTKIGANVIIDSNTMIGEQNQIFSGASIGLAPQDLKYDNTKKGITYIGNGNMLREYITIHSPTYSSGATVIENNNLLMAYVHIAHDCHIKNHVIIANNVALAGHVKIDSQAIIGGISGIHQFVQVGKLAMIGGMSKVDRDVPPYLIVEGNPSTIRTLNIVGLKRANFKKSEILLLKQIFHLIYKSHLSLTQALTSDKIKEIEFHNSLARELGGFLRKSLAEVKNGKRGLTPYKKM